ncbi:MAG TPA: 6,7-dimethyl-8-ribityllumazine synthase [Bacteroidales bacterium]|nr:6,7-dimethyl-8-ribityllumazine synthase [Bacteroidales bacterium]
MGTTNLSDYNPETIPDASEMRFGIVVSDWNREITWSLLEGATKTLSNHGVTEDNIVVKHVPGSFELTLGAQFLAEYDDLDGVICLGCVIQGETPHFTYICQGVTQGITQLNLEYNIPFIFGVLTTLDTQQAKDRSGGKHGNKGDEAAITAIKMAALQREMEK